MTDQQVVAEITATVRESDQPFAIGIRRCLEGKGIQVSTAIIADLFPDDFCFDLGLVLTKEGEIFQFGYAYPPNQESEGRFTEWSNLTSRWESTPYADQIKAAQLLLQ